MADTIGREADSKVSEVLTGKCKKVDNPSENLNQAGFLENKKNKQMNLTCIHCPSKILSSGTGVFIRKEKDLPRMNQKKNCCEVEVDAVSEWIVVDDMFLFENIGVSLTVGDVRYLSCADCEMGPVGWNDLLNQKCYLALSRVRQS